MVATAAVTALSVWALAEQKTVALQGGQLAAGQQQSPAQQPGAMIFRLLTFEVGGSGPRLGATVGNGEQDIVDVHNAILYLLTSGAPEGRSLPAIPIDMRSLIEAGPGPIAVVKSLHGTITRMGRVASLRSRAESIGSSTRTPA